MTIDLYTKVILTVIAVCLAINLMHDAPIVKQAFGQSPTLVHVVGVNSNALQGVTPIHVSCDAGCR
jgi:hypothetical protein